MAKRLWGETWLNIFVLKDLHNTSVQFEVKEYGKKWKITYLFQKFSVYLGMILPSLMQISFHCISVLPRFSVKISPPQYILPITREFSLNITARYRYIKICIDVFRSMITRKISSTSNTNRSRTRVDQGRVGGFPSTVTNKYSIPWK